MIELGLQGIAEMRSGTINRYVKRTLPLRVTQRAPCSPTHELDRDGVGTSEPSNLMQWRGPTRPSSTPRIGSGSERGLLTIEDFEHQLPVTRAGSIGQEIRAAN